MNSRSTWRWVLLAAALCGLVFLSRYYKHRPVPAHTVILPGLKPVAVSSVQVVPKGQVEIRADRTNDTWLITKPLAYPAESTNIDKLLFTLAQLPPATYIPGRELMGRYQADEEFGLAPEQVSIFVQQGEFRPHIKIGSRTVPGDQVFVQVVGDEGVFVVDASLLNVVPRTDYDWRERTLVDLARVAFDGISVTSSNKSFGLQCDTNRLWRMSAPLKARANNAKITELLHELQRLRAGQFLPQEPKPDLEALGLAPADLELTLSLGTNPVAVLQFGKSPTNDATQVFARRIGLPSIVTISNDVVASWRAASINDFRDPHLLTLSALVKTIKVRGEDSFWLLHQTNETWRVVPQNFAADSGLVADLLSALTNIPIADFAQDVVTEPVLPKYGLAPPMRQFLLFNTNSPPEVTNTPMAGLSFGTNQEAKVFVRRADEGSVYAITTNDFLRLPAASWQMRERQIWNFTTNDVVGATIQQQGRVRKIVRKGPFSWSLSTQGEINPLAVESIVDGLGQLAAAAWVGRGPQDRARFGFTDQGHQIILELKNGTKPTVEFGGESPAGIPYAAVTLDGDLWIFEFPFALYRQVREFMSVPELNL